MGAVLQLSQRSIASPSVHPLKKKGEVINLTFAQQIDRETVKTAISAFVTGSSLLRDRMYFTIATYMHNSKLQRLDLGEVVVNYNARRGLAIEAKKTIYNNLCPNCGVYIYHNPVYALDRRPVKLLHFNTVTGYYHYGCRCGSIFRKWEGYGDV